MLKSTIAAVCTSWRDWARISGGFLRSIRGRRVETIDQKLARVIILAKVPAWVAGVESAGCAPEPPI